MRILFRDVNKTIIDAILEIDPSADAKVGSIFSDPVDSVVSPSNSFGFLDGGVDWFYTQRFGPHVQENLQKKIQATLMGELLVGDAIAVPTMDSYFPWMIAAPTMRVPMIIHDPIDIFLATKVACRIADLHGLKSIVFPGMGTGCGKVKPNVAAYAMLSGAKSAFLKSPFPSSWQDAQDRHFNLVY